MILRKLFKFRERRSPEDSPGDDASNGPADSPSESRADSMVHTIQEEGLVKPFLEHLEDLRTMFMRIAITIVVAMIGSFIFRGQITEFLMDPLRRAVPEMSGSLRSLNVPDAMTISLKLAFYAGLVISFPIILKFVADFIFPGLTRREKRYVLPALVVGGGLFLTGVVFSYFMVLPAALDFFYRDAAVINIQPDWTATAYFSFVTQLSLAFGLSFELPVVIMVLVKLELLTFELMHKTRAYAVVAIIFVSAVITPTTDLLTLMALAGPLMILYEICIWLAYFMRPKPEPL